MIVIGSSLKVAPVSELVGHIPHHVPLILINREPVYHYHRSFDIQLLGYCDGIVRDLCRRLEWELPDDTVPVGTVDETVQHVEPHIYLYEGYKFDHGRHGRIFFDDESDEGSTESDTESEGEETDLENIEK